MKNLILLITCLFTLSCSPPWAEDSQTTSHQDQINEEALKSTQNSDLSEISTSENYVLELNNSSELSSTRVDTTQLHQNHNSHY